MDKSAFIRTMIEVLKYDSTYKSIEGRDQLIRLLGRAKANFLPQYQFVGGGISNQRWEIVELRFPVPLLDEANGFKDQLDKLADFVYEESEEHALKSIVIRPLVMADPEDYKEYDVIFSEYRDTVIQGIRDAKFIIWAAVAWFTDVSIDYSVAPEAPVRQTGKQCSESRAAPKSSLSVHLGILAFASRPCRY